MSDGMVLSLVIVLIVFAVFGMIAGAMAQSRNLASGAWFWLGLLFGPFALLFLAMKPIADVQPPPNVKSIDITEWENAADESKAPKSRVPNRFKK